MNQINLLFNFLNIFTKRLKFYLVALIFILCLIFIYFSIINSLSFPLIDNKISQTDSVFINLNNKVPDFKTILLSKNITNQILITTEPNLSLFYKYYRKNIFLKKLNNFFFIEKNNGFSKNLGGIILYDFNISQANKYGGLKTFISILKKRYTYKIYIIDTINNQNFLYEISPIITIDYDYPLKSKELIKYSRFASIIAKNNFNKDSLLYNYSKIGINTILSPILDYDQIDSKFYKNVVNFYNNSNKAKLIPCYKHFCYQQKSGDTHIENAVTSKSYIRLLKEDLLPYRMVDSMQDKKYLIMVGHHYINCLDSLNIASKSFKIYNFIDSAYKNSVTISDEILMRSCSKWKNFPYFYFSYNLDFVKDVKTDFILSHAGNVIDFRDKILYQLSNISNKNKRLLKILKFKNDNNLIKLSKL
jgi:hypothetical protein